MGPGPSGSGPIRRSCRMGVRHAGVRGCAGGGAVGAPVPAGVGEPGAEGAQPVRTAASRLAGAQQRMMSRTETMPTGSRSFEHDQVAESAVRHGARRPPPASMTVRRRRRRSWCGRRRSRGPGPGPHRASSRMSRSVSMPRPQWSGSRTTAAPIRRADISRAAWRSVCAGPMVSTTELMASRTSMGSSHLLGEPSVSLGHPGDRETPGETIHKFTSGGTLRVAPLRSVNKGAVGAGRGACKKTTNAPHLPHPFRAGCFGGRWDALAAGRERGARSRRRTPGRGGGFAEGLAEDSWDTS